MEPLSHLNELGGFLRVSLLFDVRSGEVMSDAMSGAIIRWSFVVHIWHPESRFQILAFVLIHSSESGGAPVTLYFQGFTDCSLEVSLLRF